MAALASQSLAIMISLIPYIRETFRRHLSTKQAVMLIEFDKMKRVSGIGSLEGDGEMSLDVLTKCRTCKNTSTRCT